MLKWIFTGIFLLAGLALPGGENLLLKQHVKPKFTDKGIFSSKYVSQEENGTVIVHITSRAGGKKGARIIYNCDLNQTKPGKIRVSADGVLISGANAKPGYGFCVIAGFYWQGGGYSGEKVIPFTKNAEGKWESVSQDFTFEKPVQRMHLYLMFAYRNGEARFRNPSVAEVGDGETAPLVRKQEEILPKMDLIPQRIYDNTEEKDSLYIARSYPGLIKLVNRNKSLPLTSAELELEMPKSIKLNVFGMTIRGNPRKETTTQSVERGDSANVKIPLRPEVLRNAKGVYYFFVHPGSAKEGDTIKWTLKLNGKVAETKNLTIRFVDLPKITLPERFKLYAHYMSILDFDTEDGLFEKNFDLCKRLGVKGCVSPMGLETTKKFAAFKENKFWLGSWSNGDCAFVPRNDDNTCRNADGTMTKKTDVVLYDYCPQFLIENIHRGVPRKQSTRSGVYLDYEPYCYQPMTAVCFCQRCRKAFAEKNAISPVPSADVIQKKHAAAWLSFREKQQAEMVGEYFKLFTKGDPGFQTIFCSLFENGSSPFSAIKNRYYESFTDMFMPMIYLKGKNMFTMFDVNCKSTSKPMLPFIYSVADGYYEDWNTPEELEIALLSIAACGGNGAALFAQLDFDGRYLVRILDAMDKIAKAERFYYDGTRMDDALKISNNAPARTIDVDGKTIRTPASPLTHFQALLHKSGGEYLVTLFNYDTGGDAHIFFSIPELTPSRTYTISELSSGRYLLNGNSSLWKAEELKKGIPVALRAYSNMQLLVKQADKEANFKNAVLGRADGTQGAGINITEKALNENGMSISRTDYRKQGVYQVKVDTPAHTVIVNQEESAKIEQWIDKKTKTEIVAEPENHLRKTGLAKEIFDLPSVKPQLKWDLISRKIFADSAEVVFSCDISEGILHGFRLRKTYRIFKNVPEIKVFYKIVVERNEKNEADFRFRVHNEADFGIRESRNTALTIRLNTPAGEVKANPMKDVAWGTPSGMFAGYLKRCLAGEFTGNALWLESAKGSLKVTFDQPEKIEQIYSYRTGNIPTFEWFCKKTDFHPDPHRSKVWETSFTMQFLPAL